MFIRYKKTEEGRSIPVAKVYTREEHPVRNSDIDPDALWAIKKMKAAGAEAYIVGGAVRDLMLGRKPKDFDVGTSLSPRQTQRLFWNSRIIGRRFKIVHLFFGESKIIEVTTFRSDEENFEDGRNNVYGSIEQDARRRDFSINALYYDPANCTILDFNNAMPDFRKKVIRSLIPLSYSFDEDPVRMIRALKYQSTTGFRLKWDVKAAIKKKSANLEKVSISRLTEEVMKIISSGSAESIFMSLKEYGLLSFLFPCLSLYLGYPEVRRSVAEMDEYVRDCKEKDIKAEREVLWYHLMKPLLVFESVNDMTVPELFSEGYRQAKVLVSPLTPPNYELEKAVDLVLADLGVKRPKAKKADRALKKKPNSLGKKRAANEELGGAKKGRDKKRKGSKAASVPPEESKTMAEIHDL